VIRRSFRIGLTLGILAGLAVALAKVRRGTPEPAARPAPPAPSPEAAPWPRLVADPTVPEPPDTALRPDPGAPPAPEPAKAAKPAKASKPAAKAAKEPKAPGKKAAKAPKKATKKPAAWVEPVEGVCPTSHPVKGKLASQIFHLPGMLNYDRTRPDRCYRDAEAAAGEGLRPAKR
jgi:hypothetical protein